jgi:hypothetical protein
MHQVSTFRTQLVGTSTAHGMQISLSLSLSLSATKKANTATFFLPGCPRQQTHKLVRRFYKRLGYCSQKQPCKSSRTAQEWQLCYVRGVWPPCDPLPFSLIPLPFLPLECSKFPHGSTSTTLPTPWLCVQAQLKENKLHFHTSQWPHFPSLVIPMLPFLSVSALVLWIVVVISSLPLWCLRAAFHTASTAAAATATAGPPPTLDIFPSWPMGSLHTPKVWWKSYKYRCIYIIYNELSSELLLLHARRVQTWQQIGQTRKAAARTTATTPLTSTVQQQTWQASSIKLHSSSRSSRYLRFCDINGRTSCCFLTRSWCSTLMCFFLFPHRSLLSGHAYHGNAAYMLFPILVSCR